MPQPQPPAGDQLAALDVDIAEAHKALKIARARCHLAPTGEAVTAWEQAEAHLNELLDARSAATHPATPAALPLTGAS